MRSLVSYLKTRIAVRRLDWLEALEKGEQHLKAGRAAESIPYFRRSLQENPGEPGTQSIYKFTQEKLAEALKKTGQHRKAAALSREMTPAQYWWDVVRAGLLVTGFIVGGGAVIMFGSMFLLLNFAGRNVPPLTLTLSRGGTATVDFRFETPVDISAQAATVVPAVRYEGLLPWAVRPWKGYEHRAAGKRPGNSVLANPKEVVFAGQQHGLIYEIGPPDIVGGYGGAQVTISADPDIPPGLYKIWLAGAYLDHTRRELRYNPDIILWLAGPSDKVTVSRDGRVGVPVIEVTVQ